MSLQLVVACGELCYMMCEVQVNEMELGNSL